MPIAEAKTERLRRYFADKEVNWKLSAAYADSASDVDILKMVGRPVAVNPEAELRRVAELKEWRIIETPEKGEKSRTKPK